MFKIIKINLFLFFISASAVMAQTQSYVITGKVGNLSSPAKAYLLHQKNGKLTTDSVVMDKGKFRFSGVAVKPEEVVYLNVSPSGNGTRALGSQFVSFYTDAKVITVLSADSLKNAKVTGGEINRDESELNAIIKALKAKQDGDGEDMPPEMKSAYVGFIKSHTNSIISLKALKEISGNYPDPAEFDPLFNSLSSKVRASRDGILYAEKLSGMKRTNIGVPAPEFSMLDTADRDVSLLDFKGKYVLLDFWASWCPPCRAESPFLVEAYSDYKDKNFTILSVSLDGPGAKAKWLKAIQDDHLTWTHLSDLQYENKVAKLYSVSSIPQNFLIDPQGRIVAKNLRGEALKAKLKELID